jgi:hypothetical protein
LVVVGDETGTVFETLTGAVAELVRALVGVALVGAPLDVVPGVTEGVAGVGTLAVEIEVKLVVPEVGVLLRLGRSLPPLKSANMMNGGCVDYGSN